MKNKEKFSLLLEAVYHRTVLKPYRPEDSGAGDQLSKSSSDDHTDSEEESKSTGKGNPSDKENVDKQSKKFGEKTEKQGEKEKGDPGEGEGEGDGNPGSNPSDGGGPGSGKTGNRSSGEIKPQQPKFNWRVLIKQALAKSFKMIPEETRAKYSRRTMSQIGVLQSKKAAAVMPGEKHNEVPDLKIAFVLDVSGSMTSYYSRCFSEIHSAMTSKDVSGASCTFITYSNDVKMFYVDLVKQKGIEIASLKDRNKKSDAKSQLPVQTLLFKADVGGGTTLTNPELQKNMEELLKEGPVILMTDEDAYYQVEYIRKLMQNPNFMMILASKQIYDEFVKTCGGTVSTKITHF